MKQFIKCPECSSIELATIGHTFPFPTYLHECRNCSMVIMESEWEPVKALSVQQPWAWLIVNGHKDIENRNTLKNIRGTFLIHAGQKFDNGWWKSDQCQLFDEPMPNIDQLEKGGIVGYVQFTGCVHKSDLPWFAGPNGLVIENAKPLDFTPCKGAQGIFYPKID